MANGLFARAERAMEETRRLHKNRLRIQALVQQTVHAFRATREDVKAYRQKAADGLARRSLQALAPMPDTIIRPRARRRGTRKQP
ncbi:hypothetical protein [Methylobacterium nodulans]|uniref:Uncharacterized protein n=1 Tax=Methylobacterium nodulans (strain LMG 21967 / CNCM I-2342 / ORS 2060) TaxID=460265 RepID=B8IX79_METNO|nr:hypothetical protein [Methylobacterium nodulans]ACL63120.1 conserved hypothetical protein [Methylobacterium nodulans ORS 2060]